MLLRALLRTDISLSLTEEDADRVQERSAETLVLTLCVCRRKGHVRSFAVVQSTEKRTEKETREREEGEQNRQVGELRERGREKGPNQFFFLSLSYTLSVPQGLAQTSKIHDAWKQGKGQKKKGRKN